MRDYDLQLCDNGCIHPNDGAVGASKPRGRRRRTHVRTAAFGWVMACGLFCGALLSGGNGVASADATTGAGASSNASRDTSNSGSATPGSGSGRSPGSSPSSRIGSDDRTGPGTAKLEQLKATPSGPRVPPPLTPAHQPGNSVGGARPLSASAASGGISQNGPNRNYQPPLSPAVPSVPGMPAEPGAIDADTGSLGPVTLEPAPITMPPLIGAPIAAEIPLRFPGSAGAADASRGFARSGEGSVQRQRPTGSAQSGTNQVPESFRVGYPQYLREAKIGEVAVLALPGFAGLLALTALGGFLGYRQARAGHVPRTAGVSRFLE